LSGRMTCSDGGETYRKNKTGINTLIPINLEWNFYTWNPVKVAKHFDR
jgi:hypothetical protein